MKFGTIGDLHLDKARIANIIGHKESTDMMIAHTNEILSIFYKEGVEFVTFLGDLCDKPTLSDYAELKLMELLSSWDDRLNIHIILGNHDVEQETVHSLCKIEWLASSYWKTIKVHTKYYTEKIDKHWVEFLPFPLTTGKKKNSICFGHFDRPGAVGDNGLYVRSHNTVDDKDTRIYVLGHLHTPQQVGNSYFPGTSYQTSFGETLTKGYGLFDTSDLKNWFIEFEPPFKFVNLDISKQKQLDNLGKYINKGEYIKLFIKRKLHLPSNLQISYPQIIDIVAYKNKQDLQQLQTLEQTEQNIAYGVTDNLDDFLKAKGRTPEQIAKAKELVNDAINSM